MVTVIIPTYNRAGLLRQCLDSVFAQTFTDYEVIVADDGSTDGTASVVSAFPQVRYMQLDHSGIPGIPRNAGVRESRGEWLAFLDSDDLWLPEKLATQYEYAIRPDREDSAPRLIHTREIWDRNGKPVSQSGQRHMRSGDVFADALVKCMIGPSTVMMRREVFLDFGGFDETLEIAEDYELWLRITDRYPVHYIDEALTIKRAGEWEQLSEKYGQIEIFRIQALEKLVAGYSWSNSSHAESAKEELARKYLIYISGLEKRGKREELETYKAKLRELEEKT